MPRARTSKFIIAAMTPEERSAHFREVWRKSRERCAVVDNARRRARYAADPKKVMRSQKERNDRNPARRRAVVRASKHRKPWKTILRAVRDRAAKRGIVFSVSDGWADKAYTGRCAITGVEFIVGRCVEYHGPNPYSPSLDRIVPALGYTEDNCRFILHAVNMFKNTLSDSAMYDLAEALLANRLAVS